jgi:putative DNA primase/helicase
MSKSKLIELRDTFKDDTMKEGLETLDDLIGSNSPDFLIKSPKPLVEEYSNVIAPPEPHASVSELKIYNIEEFLKLCLPPREFIIDPIIPTQGISMLYASRGVGKTFLALSLAYGVAIGHPVLSWNIFPNLAKFFT